MEHSELRRSMTWVQGAAMTIGGVLGAGILILPAAAAGVAGPASLVAWLFMTLLSFPIALTLGRLAVKVPDAGGIAAYVRTAFGPVAGGMMSWLYLGLIPLDIPIVALIGANYLGGSFHFSHGQVSALALLMLLISTGLNHRGLSLSGRIQAIVIVLIGCLLIAAALAAVLSVKTAAFHPFFTNGWSAVGTAAVMIFWSFVGWETVLHLVEEFKKPSRDVPLSLLVAVFFVGAGYLAVSFVTIGSHSYGGKDSLSLFSTLIGKGFGAFASVFTSVLALFITFATTHTLISGYSRLVYAQAREGDFPAFFSRIHSKYKTPAVAIWGLFFSFLPVILLDGFFKPDLARLVEWPSATLIVLYIATMIAAMRIFFRKDIGFWTALAPAAVFIILFPLSGLYIGDAKGEKEEKK